MFRKLYLSDRLLINTTQPSADAEYLFGWALSYYSTCFQSKRLVE